MGKDYLSPSGRATGTYAAPEIDAKRVESILQNSPAAAAFGIASTDILIWIHGVLVAKGGQRRRVLEAFLDAPNHRLTCGQLASIATQYGARIFELRAAGFPIPNMPSGDGGTFFELLITAEQEKQIRAALAVADALKLPRRIRKAEPQPPAPQQSAPPHENKVGQFGFGFGSTVGPNTFLDLEKGVRR